MESEIKKTVKKKLREFSMKEILLANKLKYVSDGFDIIDNSLKIGRLGYAFVSSKFAEYGSSVGMYVVFSLTDGKLISVVNNLNLSYSNYFHNNHNFSFTSLSYLPNLFFKNGTVSFFENENIDEKCNLIVKKVQNLYLSKIQDFINSDIKTIDDILEAPKNYGRPVAFALIVCYLNNRLDMIDDVIKRVKIKKLYDSSQDKIDEILSKLSFL